MKQLLILPLLLLASCATKGNSSKEDKMELSLHKVRTELEDIKHDLNTYEIEHHVLEGKFVDQNNTIANLKQTAIETQGERLEKLVSEITALEKRISQLTKQQEKVSTEIRTLTTQANDTVTALTQYKEKITEVEKALSLHMQPLESDD